MKPIRDRIAVVILSVMWAVVIVFMGTGCATRTIYVPHGDPVRLAADAPEHPVWVRDADGHWVRGRVSLKEGWYALPKP